MNMQAYTDAHSLRFPPVRPRKVLRCKDRRQLEDCGSPSDRPFGPVCPVPGFLPSPANPYGTTKAGDGNRTHVTSLEGWSSTIELHPHIQAIKYHESAVLSSACSTRRKRERDAKTQPPSTRGLCFAMFVIRSGQNGRMSSSPSASSSVSGKRGLPHLGQGMSPSKSSSARSSFTSRWQWGQV